MWMMTSQNNGISALELLQLLGWAATRMLGRACPSGCGSGPCGGGFWVRSRLTRAIWEVLKLAYTATPMWRTWQKCARTATLEGFRADSANRRCAASKGSSAGGPVTAAYMAQVVDRFGQRCGRQPAHAGLFDLCRPPGANHRFNLNQLKHLNRLPRLACQRRNRMYSGASCVRCFKRTRTRD